MTTSSSDIQAVFAPIRKALQDVQQIHDTLRTHRDHLEVSVRAVTRVLTDLHDTATSDIPSVLVRLRSALVAVGPPLARLQAALDDPAHFYRFCDLWGHQRVLVVSAAVILCFVDDRPLFHLRDIVELLGHDVRLTPDDYVLGICHALSDLVRLSMRRVILRDYRIPMMGAVFATLVYDGLKELNFRNDVLRRRFDAAKYDVKRLEEIVYDLSIRNLLPAYEPSPLIPKAPDALPSTKKRPVQKADADAPSKRVKPDGDQSAVQGNGTAVPPAEDTLLVKSASKSTTVTDEVTEKKRQNDVKDADVVMGMRADNDV